MDAYTPVDIDQLIAAHQSRRLLIGEQLALLKADWRQAHGKDLGPRQQERAWARFLAEQRFPNPSNKTPDCITAPVAEQLINEFQQHLLQQHISATR